MGYNLKTDYNFSAVDSVMPDIVMSDICNELEKITKGFVVANVRKYDGKIESYDTMGAMAALAASLQTSMRIDIQDKLGVIEETSFKYEMYLTANQIENYWSKKRQKRIAKLHEFVIMKWQQIGNRKSASQNNIRN